MKVGGFPVYSYERLSVKAKPDPSIPKTYLDLKIAKNAQYEWVAYVMSDKYGFYFTATGNTKEEAETTLYQQYNYRVLEIL